MKIVILSGSPHKSGTTAKLADSFTRGVESAGHEIVRFDTAFLNVHPCMACERCHTSDDAVCVFQDDMLAIGKALASADCVALVSPIYYYGVCTQLKAVIDRFYAIEPAIRHHQKTVWITAMADDREESVEAANAWYKAATAWLEWQDCGILNAFACTTADDLQGTDYEERAYRLGAGIC